LRWPMRLLRCARNDKRDACNDRGCTSLSLRGLRSRPRQSHLLHWENKPMGTKQFYVYIMTNKVNTVLYTGVTNDIRKRVYEHKQKLVEGFTKKYNVVKLVYYEAFADCASAIQREKQIKSGPRKKKEELINGINKEWRDLYEEL